MLFVCLFVFFKHNSSLGLPTNWALFFSSWTIVLEWLTAIRTVKANSINTNLIFRSTSLEICSNSSFSSRSRFDNYKNNEQNKKINKIENYWRLVYSLNTKKFQTGGRSFSFCEPKNLLMVRIILDGLNYPRLRHNPFASIVYSFSYGLWAQVEIPILRSEFSCSCAVNTHIIITYYKQTTRVIILKSTQNKTNHFEMIMKSLYGLCNSKL